MPVELPAAALASFLAGLVDSMVGGGGLILLPAMLSLYPAAPPATLMGTNKSAGIWGTGIAAARYSRRVTLDWSWLLPAALAALGGAYLGAWTLTLVDPAFLRRLLPALLLGVLAYTVANPDLGLHHAPHRSARATRVIGVTIGAVIGWYDGFFGPGTGSFLIFLFVRLLDFDFLHASASAKVLNVATNIAALALLGATGHVWWRVGAVLAVANVLGSLIGTHLALRHGAGLVRRAFLGVVGALILKAGYDAFLRGPQG